MSVLSTVYPTILDVARRTDPNGGIAAIAELLQYTYDMLDDIPMIEGNLPTGHQSTVRTSNPTPTFRLLNGGVVPSKTATGQIVDTCAIIENRSHIDKDLAMLNGNTAQFRLSEDKGIIMGMADAYATALISGDVSINPEQFNGLNARYYGLTSSSCPTTYANVIDAGGTGSDNTSIWLVAWSPDTVFGIYPKGSQGGLSNKDLGEISILVNTTTGAYMQALASVYQWKVGLCVRDWRCVVRIANIDVSDLATAGNSTDTSANILKFMLKALNKLPPSARGANKAFYMTETTRAMLGVKQMDKSNLQLTLDQVKTPNFTRDAVLKFQGVPCRRMDSITEAETALS